jgi:hypothetical protein
MAVAGASLKNCAARELHWMFWAKSLTSKLKMLRLNHARDMRRIKVPSVLSEYCQGAASDAAARQISPESGSYDALIAPLRPFRTHPRDDSVRQLFELAVR